MSAKKDNGIVIGGEPRIDFLPPEIKQKKEARRTLRGLIALVVLVLAICVAAYAGVTTAAIASQFNLQAEQARTQVLLQQQAEFSEAREVASKVAAAKDARIVGSAYEILWRDYLADLEAQLPAGTTINSLEIDSQSAVEGSPVSNNALDESHVATLTVGSLAPVQGDVARWLDNLVNTRGYAGAWVSQMSLDEESGLYEVSTTILVNIDAFEKRFFDEEPAAEVSETVEGEG